MKPDDVKPAADPYDPTRREFLATTGAGLFVFFSVRGLGAQQPQEPSRLPGRQT